MIRKKIVFLVLLVFVSVIEIYPQAQKPRIMVVPSRSWCKTNGYWLEFDNQGTKVGVPDYRKAFDNNTEVASAIAAIGGIMSERGFPLVSLDQALLKAENQSAQNTARNDGGVKDPFTILMETVSADVELQLSWTVNQEGLGKYINFMLVAYDMASTVQIGQPAEGKGTTSRTADVTGLLREAVAGFMSPFEAGIMNYFEKLFVTGRQISVEIMVNEKGLDDKLPDGLDTEMDNGDEIRKIIRKWMNNNVKTKGFTTTVETEKKIAYEQVFIPLQDEDGDPINARDWIDGLRKELRKIGIQSVSDSKGIGNVTLILGGK